MRSAASDSRQKGDITSAYKVISCGLVGLSRAEVFVAHALLRHLDNKDGTCFPTVERLAQMSDVDRSSVIRATGRLCEGPDRLFDKVRKGGKGRTSSANYTIRWQRVRELEAEIASQFKGENDPKETSNSRTGATLNSRTGATLTSVHGTPVHNFHQGSTSQGPKPADKDQPKTTSKPKRKSALDEMGVRVKVAPDRKGGKRGGKKADDRWNADLLRCGTKVYGDVIEWLTIEIAGAATQAERQKYHQGIAFIRDRIYAAGQLDLARKVGKFCYG